MSTEQQVKDILAEALQLGDQVADFTRETTLLGELPEFDSMAVVSVLTSMEEHFGFMVDDDEVSAETFASVGTLIDFVEEKLAE